MALFRAPHRAMFFVGALQLVLTILLWLLELLAWQRGASFLSFDLPPVYMHAIFMYFGVFPFFMFGFLLTVFPRWLNVSTQQTYMYVLAWFMLTGGWLLVYAGVFLFGLLLTVGLSLCVMGWFLVAAQLLRVFVSRTKSASHYEYILLAAIGLGTLMLVMVLLGHVRGNLPLIRLALDGALWLFLLPVAFTVSHRMIPFFSSLVIKDYRPYQPVSTLAIGIFAMLGYYVARSLDWSYSWLFILMLAIVSGWLSVSWKLLQSLPVRLLAMLHIAFAWLSLACFLFALQGLFAQIGEPWFLGRAPLHAVSIGFLASLVIAFASRVSLGHSGRNLIADSLTWRCFLLFQLVAILRVVADLPKSGMSWSQPLYTAAAVLWVLAAVVWSTRYLPIYMQPRLDGRPG